MSINNIKMLHKPPNQKLLLTNVNAILNKRSNSTIINELKPMRITKRYKTQSYNNLYITNIILSTRRMKSNLR